jgi:hypothetical protein
MSGIHHPLRTSTARSEPVLMMLTRTPLQARLGTKAFDK